MYLQSRPPNVLRLCRVINPLEIVCHLYPIPSCSAAPLRCLESSSSASGDQSLGCIKSSIISKQCVRLYSTVTSITVKHFSSPNRELVPGLYILRLEMMPDHACVIERRFFANGSLLKCRRSSSSRGCFARLSMHRVFSTELSIALTDADDFFKCIQAAVSWEIDRSIDRERERALSWKDCAASRTRIEATCCLLAAS